MTTNLLFGTNSAMLGATVTASSTMAGCSANNVLAGPRMATWKSDNAATNVHTIIYQPAATAAIDYIAIARANLAIGIQGCVFKLDYSDNGAAYTEYVAEAAIQPGGLVTVSASGEDYYYKGALSAVHPYWKLTLTLDGNDNAELSKLYIGTAIDLGRDPDDISVQRVKESETAIRPKHRINLHYSGVTYTAAMAAKAAMFDIADFQNIFMFTAANHGMFGGQRCFYGRLTNVDLPQVITNQNDISFTFQEVL
jgi:outer membrane murein-binding lipoprotein Lpp